MEEIEEKSTDFTDYYGSLAIANTMKCSKAIA